MVWWSRTDAADQQGRENHDVSSAAPAQTCIMQSHAEEAEDASVKQTDLIEHVRTAVKGKLASDDVQIDLADAKGTRIQSNTELFQAMAAKDRMPLRALPSDLSTELTAQGVEQLHELRAQVLNERVAAVERRIDAVAEEVASELQSLRASARSPSGGSAHTLTPLMPPSSLEARLDCLAAEVATEQRLREEATNKVEDLLQVVLALARKSNLGGEWSRKLTLLSQGMSINGADHDLGLDADMDMLNRLEETIRCGPPPVPGQTSSGKEESCQANDMLAEMQRLREQVQMCEQTSETFHDELAAMFNSLSTDVTTTREVQRQQILKVTEGMTQLGQGIARRLESLENHGAVHDQRLVDLDVARSVLTQQLDVQKENVRVQFEKTGDQVNKLRDETKRLRNQGLDLRRRSDDIMNRADILGVKLQQFTAQVEDLVIPMKDQMAQQVEVLRRATAEGGVLRQSSAGSSTAVIRQSSASSTACATVVEAQHTLTATVPLHDRLDAHEASLADYAGQGDPSSATDESKDDHSSQHVSPQHGFSASAGDENVYSSARAVDGNVSLASPDTSDRLIPRETVTGPAVTSSPNAVSSARNGSSVGPSCPDRGSKSGVVDDLAETVPIDLGREVAQARATWSNNNAGARLPGAEPVIVLAAPVEAPKQEDPGQCYSAASGSNSGRSRKEDGPHQVVHAAPVASPVSVIRRESDGAQVHNNSARSSSEKQLVRCESQPLTRAISGPGTMRPVAASSPVRVSTGARPPPVSSVVGGGGGAPFHRGTRQYLPGAGTPTVSSQPPSRTGTPGPAERNVMPMPARSRELPQARTVLRQTFGSASTGQLHRVQAHIVPAEAKQMTPSTPGKPLASMWR
mmetsp:Transcript_68809/g.165167  ORF Transcript_68809/g.165167 Transcript_68809/m.165167 type:complete len:863 (+) Transcript_68809:117-2705(+)